MATLVYACRQHAQAPQRYCPQCRWLNVLAAEAEERIELLAASAVIPSVPEEPSPLFWLLAEQRLCPARPRRESVLEANSDDLVGHGLKGGAL